MGAGGDFDLKIEKENEKLAGSLPTAKKKEKERINKIISANEGELELINSSIKVSKLLWFTCAGGFLKSTLFISK